MFLIDSHCHLDKLNYTSVHIDVKDVLNKAFYNNIHTVLSVSTSISSFKKTQILAHSYKNVLFSCGIHPLEANDFHDIDEFKKLSLSNKVIALGETGLDYYHIHNKKKQEMLFRQHIILAKKINKPLIIHVRNAHNDVLNILKEENADQCSGIIHCFTENIEIAKKFLDLGFYISFSGMITFKNMQYLSDVASYVPLNKLLIETDSPYLSPVPYRGKENQPAYIKYVAEYISNIKKIKIEEFASITTFNFCKLFNLILHEQ